MNKLFILWLFVAILAITGEIKCIIKTLNCNWEPIGKAEIIYTAGVFTGFGAVIGYFDIKDN